MKKNNNVSAGIGGSLIIIIFVVLCLTIFSVLSFTTSYSDLKLAKKTEVMIQNYYEINGNAEQKLSEIYEKLIASNDELNIDTKNSENFKINAIKNLKDMDEISVIEQNGSDFSIYYESLSEMNQKICVTLNIYYDETKNVPYYEIASWNLSSIEIPNYEETYDLWEGIDG